MLMKLVVLQSTAGNVVRRGGRRHENRKFSAFRRYGFRGSVRTGNVPGVADEVSVKHGIAENREADVSTAELGRAGAEVAGRGGVVWG